MKAIKYTLIVEVTVPAQITGTHPEEIWYFEDRVFEDPDEGGELYLHSNHLGMMLGQVVVKKIEWKEEIHE